MTYQILLVEDDSQIREVICDYFQDKSEGEMVIHAYDNGDGALEAIYENEFDLCILDVMLPGADGFEICRTIRRDSIVPIIFITARGREEDVLYGYQMGCDDYVVKPFSLAEFYAKTQALLKRAKGMVAGPWLSCGEIAINPSRYLVSVEGHYINLPPKQFALLKYLMENKNTVVPRETLLVKIWGYDYEGGERVVDNHIKKLRHAVGPYKKQIKTVITKGYKITD